MWGWYLATITSKIAVSHVIGHDDNDIWLFVGWFRRTGASRQAHGTEAEDKDARERVVFGQVEDVHGGVVLTDKIPFFLKPA